MNDINFRHVAEQALAHGIIPWPVRHDGSKAPRAQGWGRDDPVPDDETLLGQFRDSDTGWGFLTGSKSQHLEMIEFEAVALAEGLYEEFYDALVEAGGGLDEVWDRMVEGCSIRSGGGGLHVLFYTPGPAEPNLALAERPGGEHERHRVVLIETRGEGGFVVGPNTNGKVNPKGGAYRLESGKLSSIATITVAERDALYAVARSFDQMPKPVTVDMGNLGGDARELRDWVVDNIGVESLLIEGGFTKLSTNRHGEVHFARPAGKKGFPPKLSPNTTSLMLHTDSAVTFYSTSRSDAWATALMSGPSYDWASPLGVLAAVSFAGDITEAMRWVREQINPPSEAPEAPSGGLNLPEWVWDTSDFMTAVRDHADYGLASRDAVLGSALTRAAAMVPPSVKLPDIVGDEATFDYISCVVAKSSGGKSISNAIAKRMMPIRSDGVILADQSPGSGEGLIQAFIDYERNEDGKKVGDPSYKHSTVRAVHLVADEGTALHEQAGRSGTTIIQTLCSAWSGSRLGQLNASTETKRLVPAGKRRVACTINIQTKSASLLLGWESVGLPQRILFTWAHGDAPELDERPEPFVPESLPMQDMPRTIDVDPEVRRAVREERKATRSGELVLDDLDGHRKLLQLKTAGLLALMDSRSTITGEDWGVAEEIVACSARVRTHIGAVAAQMAMEKTEAAGRAEGKRRFIAEETRTAEEAALVDRLATKMADRLADEGGRLGVGKLIRLVTSSKTRHRGEAAIQLGVDRGLWTLEGDDEHGWTAVLAHNG